MELEDMKNMWQKMDATFEQQKTVNEKLLKYLLKEKTVKPLNTISNMEYVNAVSIIVIFIGMLFAIPFLESSAGIISCYVFLLIALVVTFLFSIKSINILRSIDIGNTPVKTLMERVTSFKLLTRRLQLSYTILGPLFLGTALVVATQIVNGVNLLDNISRLLPKLGIGTVAYAIILVALYQQYYFKNIKTIQNNLKELKEFDLSD